MVDKEERDFRKEMAAIWSDGATDDFIEALQEISEASGPFKRDPHEHAQSCIRSMQATAIAVLKKHGFEPRGVPVDDR